MTATKTPLQITAGEGPGGLAFASCEPTPQSPEAEAAAMREIEALQGTLSEAELDHLENELRLRAAVLGWTGNPLRQWPTSVLAALKSVLKQRDEKLPDPDALKKKVSERLLPAPAPRLTPDAVCRQCDVVKESLLAVRNAWRLSLLDMTDREAWLLADELEIVGKQFYSLANDIRATGGNKP